MGVIKKKPVLIYLGIFYACTWFCLYALEGEFKAGSFITSYGLAPNSFRTILIILTLPLEYISLIVYAIVENWGHERGYYDPGRGTFQFLTNPCFRFGLGPFISAMLYLGLFVHCNSVYNFISKRFTR